jgi:hypothetical protein
MKDFTSNKNNLGLRLLQFRKIRGRTGWPVTLLEGGALVLPGSSRTLPPGRIDQFERHLRRLLARPTDR